MSGLGYARAICAERGQYLADAVLRAGLLRAGVLPEWHERWIAGYSPAQRLQLALAVATLKNARALIIDDPAADLEGTDPDHFVASLRRLRKRGKAILLATRDLDFARRLATRIVLMENGTVLETIDPNTSRKTFNAGSYLAELVG
jgi:ABC-2 type transport system ATP-binding protein